MVPPRWLLVSSAVEIAHYFGVSDLVIGLTIVAVGTSLPEVVTSIVAALRGERDIAVGNVVGSNIFNIVSSGDVIPRILPAEWGFYRNGNDRFLPSTVIPAELQALNDRSAGMEGTPIDFGRLAVSEETDAVLRSMLDLFCDRQTYYEDYEDAMRCMLQCATTRTEEEVTRGIVRDDAAVVAQLPMVDAALQTAFAAYYEK